MEKVTADTFRPHVREAFVLETSVGEVSLILDEVECKDPSNAGPFHGFSLFFSGPGHAFLPQGNYVLRQATLGTIPMFLVPIGETEKGFRYQAAFSVRK